MSSVIKPVVRMLFVVAETSLASCGPPKQIGKHFILFNFH